MIGLVLVEIQRLFARRITLVTGVLLVAMAALIGLAMVLFLLAFSGYNDFDEPPPVAEPGPAFGELAQGAVPVAAFFTLLAAYLLGASAIAAEYASGSLATWLTFVPSRLKVFFSKLVAVLVGSLAVGVAGLGLTLAVCAIVAGAGGGGLEGAEDSLARATRALLVVVIAGVFGFCVASVTRNTGIAVGLVLGYLIAAYVFTNAMSVVEDLQWLQPWLPEQNVLAAILGGTTYYIDQPGPNQEELTFGQAVAYWIAVVAALVTATALLFRRRDVV